MKNGNVIVIAVLVLQLLSGCSGTKEEQQNLIIEEVEFDLDVAIKMVSEGEKRISMITTNDIVSREEFDIFLGEMNRIYDGPLSPNWDLMFFNNIEFEDKSNTTLHLNQNIFYPTIFHEDIELVSAFIENTYSEDYKLRSRELFIKEEYLGDDEMLNGWQKTYIYSENEEGKWELQAFDGQLNLIGDGFNRVYLKLK